MDKYAVIVCGHRLELVTALIIDVIADEAARILIDLQLVVRREILP
jgi:hypothetical protein